MLTRNWCIIRWLDERETFAVAQKSCSVINTLLDNNWEMLQSNHRGQWEVNPSHLFIVGFLFHSEPEV
ncbi:hypothetical protein Hamer_G010971 [Homarus americanus]|uniref:Uncharacterized protein n=1 Tax=Homarus americanus TaxID=6706 RepID=A0A8J5K3X1_HOMAM|nr:hypothetical protein Hamer_G010971 [Homarus americanus]